MQIFYCFFSKKLHILFFFTIFVPEFRLGTLPTNRNMEYFALSDKNILLHSDGSHLSEQDWLMLADLLTVSDRFVEVGSEISVLAVSETSALPDGYAWQTIRQQFAIRGFGENNGLFRLARAKALVEWRKRTQFCGCCGTPLVEHESLTARVCPKCENLIFPRIEPCIIVIIKRGDEILLARHVQRNQDIYACIAGFMEAGETVEQAVMREIYEETHIRVRNVRYYGSQSWPFPAQLMLGFTAEYESGELSLQEDEIADARWFHRDDCPASPQPGSIAYRLIHEA